jgi:hypothetical protein
VASSVLIFVVEDEEAIRELLEEALEVVPGIPTGPSQNFDNRELNKIADIGGLSNSWGRPILGCVVPPLPTRKIPWTRTSMGY